MSTTLRFARGALVATALLASVGLAFAQSSGGSGGSGGSSGSGSAGGSSGSMGGGAGGMSHPSYSTGAASTGEISASGSARGAGSFQTAPGGATPPKETKPKIVRCPDGSQGDLNAGGCLGGN